MSGISASSDGGGWFSAPLDSELIALADERLAQEYVGAFADLLAQRVAFGRDSRVCSVLCGAGAGDAAVAELLPGAHVHGCDPSDRALMKARRSAGLRPGEVYEYRRLERWPAPYPAGAFSHAFSLAPAWAQGERALLFGEMARLLAPRGQALLAAPLAGSFAELFDLLAEHAVRRDRAETAAEIAARRRALPTRDDLARECVAGGFGFVDVTSTTLSLAGAVGAAGALVPAVRALASTFCVPSLASAELRGALSDVAQAVASYFSEGGFAITVEVGVVSGRMP